MLRPPLAPRIPRLERIAVERAIYARALAKFDPNLKPCGSGWSNRTYAEKTTVQISTKTTPVLPIHQTPRKNAGKAASVRVGGHSAGESKQVVRQDKEHVQK